VPTPKNCLFFGATLDFGRIVTWKWMKPIGIIEAMDFDAAIRVRVKLAA